MCGIAGYIDFTRRSDKDTLVRMTNMISHRGPDDCGYEYLQEEKAVIGFGFRRLSIIELSALGHQPMFDDDGMLMVVFNGEIYNYKEIRKELEKAGYVFKSNSDTEVILKAYLQWGKNCVQRFIGMFAIAIWDKRNNKIILFRDRPGVKPLFYYWKDNLFLFASELKSFHQHSLFKKEIDFNALSLFFRHSYIASPHCIFRNTNKLPPGHILELSLSSLSVNVTKYWDVIDSYNQPRLDISFDEAVKETEKILSKSFRYRMISDVPVGIFLSGGYDSSVVAALLQKNSSQKIKTFTIGFHDKKLDEAGFAKKIAAHLGTDHIEYYCTSKEATEILPQLPFFYDEPMGDSSAIQTILLSKIARQYVTVALSADGADEIFAGYPKYNKILKYCILLDKLPVSITKATGSIINLLTPAVTRYGNYTVANFYDKITRILKLRTPVFAFNIFTERMTFQETEHLFRIPLKHLITPLDEDEAFKNHNDFLSRFQAMEYKTVLSDLFLQKMDRATMSVSLEGREPFLDQHIIEWVARLPSEFKLKNNTGKIILKEIAHKYIPETIMNRPKMGFDAPVEKWCKNELKDILLYYLDEQKIRKQGILDEQKVSLMLTHFLNGKKTNFQNIWNLLTFQMWYEKWME